MEYVKLSELIQKLRHPERAEEFVRQVRQEVSSGQLRGVLVEGTISLPYGRKTQSAREMLLEYTPILNAWFDMVNSSMKPKRRTTYPDADAILSGRVDFNEQLGKTREELAERRPPKSNKQDS